MNLRDLLRSATLVVIGTTAWTQATAGDLPLDPKVAPGYRPPADSAMDERGIWMEMQESESELKHSPLLLRDEALVRWVESVTCRVAGAYCQDVRVYVVRNPTFNASMAPNGTMIVHTGLLLRVASEDQLASVLGHELAHYTQAHSLRRLRAAKNRMAAGAVVSMGLAVGGVSGGGLPEIFAIASVMGFTRSQESEADLMGTYFISEGGYDPRAAADVWELLRAEEERASIKHPRGPLFLSSHPPPETRAKDLAVAAEHLAAGEDRVGQRREALLAALAESYPTLMEEQIKRGDFGRLMLLLDRHEAMGMPAGDVEYFRGEAWRVRGGAGDHEKAMDAYRRAAAAVPSSDLAFRELGYLLYKHGEPEAAREALGEYLQRRPQAPDAEMVRFYLEGGW